ncbi:hypothetical protein L9F63_011044 [Diploptera punctata]|uniref:Scavenger receptor class B member 1 n=1 Tax=Diploptera punctata TaxID=6984 RepID=A0AAD8AFR4_DIPPU|nr:hypothetical protein L9F63_011044 [Diploptera punctata]
MRKGWPPYNWWVVPDVDVLVKMHVFNITNYDEIMSGTDTVFKVQEVGPIIYREDLWHSNVTKNPNGTMAFVSNRVLEYLPEQNTINLNDTVYVPNLAYLGIASYLSDWHFITRMGFNLLARKYNISPIIKITVYNLLWNYTDPLLETVSNVVPSLLPITNIGYLEMLYRNFSDENSVFIGIQHPRKYFTMDTYHRQNRFGFWPNKDCDSVQNATEGILYHQDITKDDVLYFFRKAMCRVAAIKFKEETERFGLKAYNFSLPLNTYHRPLNGSYDCYTLPGDTPLPDGLSDISQCFFHFPIVSSFPHFLSVKPSDLRNLEGYTPDEKRHGCYSAVEPITGVPLESVARIQCNLRIKDVSSFPPAAPFKNMFLPLFWLELKQDQIPQIMKIGLYLFVVITPKIQALISTALVALGIALLYFRVIKVQKTTEYKGTYISLDPIPRTM